MTLSKHWRAGKYSFQYLELSRGVRGTVSWDTDGYKGSFMGLVLLKRFTDMEQAQAAVERLAKKHLTDLLNKLEV